MTEPKKQDGTMELDVGQIDLLDLPLPPRSTPSMSESVSEEPRVSKGPPPLPPSSLPPAEPQATSADEAAQRAFAAEAAFNPLPPPEPPANPAGAVSARKLVAEQKPESGAAMRFLVGVGGATLLCVALFFGYRMLTKKAPQPAPQASATVTPTQAPTQAFTMAPIEFTSSPDDSASAAPSVSAAPATSSRGHAQPSTTSTSAAPHATTAPASTKRTDEVIKVEN